MKIRFKIGKRKIRDVCIETDKFLLDLKISQKDREDIVVALDEALTNIYEHGYSFKKCPVGLEVFTGDKKVYTIISDFGKHFKFEEKTVHKKNEEYIKSRIIGGFGIGIIKKLMDIVISFPLFNENILIMAKKINKSIFAE